MIIILSKVFKNYLFTTFNYIAEYLNCLKLTYDNSQYIETDFLLVSPLAPFVVAHPVSQVF